MFCMCALLPHRLRAHARRPDPGRGTRAPAVSRPRTLVAWRALCRHVRAQEFLSVERCTTRIHRSASITAPQGKNVLLQWVESRPPRASSFKKSKLGAAAKDVNGAKGSPVAGASTWKDFTPAPTDRTLSAERREQAFSILRDTLGRHFLFAEVAPTRLMEYVRTMRYKMVRQGESLTVQVATETCASAAPSLNM